VLAAGATHPSGKIYTAYGEQDDAAWADTGLFAILEGMKPKPKVTGHLEDPIPVGERNSRLTSIGGSLRKQGLHFELIAAILAKTNRESCRPPLEDDEVVRIAKSVSRYVPEPDEAPGDMTVERERKLLPVISWQDIDPAPAVEWLWEPYLPQGRLMMMAGSGGVGKSMAAATMALYVVQGRGPDGPIEAGNVLWFAAEDDHSDVVARMEAAGANRADDRKVFFVDDTGMLFHADNQGHLQALKDTIEDLDISLVIFDPVRSFLGEKISWNKESDVRPPLERINKAAIATGATIVGIHHWNKGGDDHGAVNRATGSHAFTDVVRHQVSMVWIGSTEMGQGAFAVTKSNIGPTGHVREYGIQQGDFPVWIAGPEHSANTLDEWIKVEKAREFTVGDDEGEEPNLIAAYAERHLAPGSAIPPREKLMEVLRLSQRETDDYLAELDDDPRVTRPGARRPRIWNG
jgi:hypothetical protein